MSTVNYNAIEICGLQKKYKDFSLQNVSFSVPSGCIMGFIGENGAGKTTTMKAALGLIHPDGGTVEVLGKNPFTARKEINEDLGVVMEGSFFYQGMRARDVDKVMTRLHKRWDSALFAQYCERFSLPTTKEIKDYSKGMKAKLSLITAISHHPKLLVLDEATSGLDPVVRREILDIFMEFIEDEAHTILLSSHITSDLEQIADYITFIHAGKIVFSMVKHEMQEQYAVVKCAKADAASVDAAYIIGRRDSKFDTELLVNNKAAVRRTSPSIMIEPASIDDIMTFFAKEHAQ